jgi:hypothetical protein
MPLPPLYLYEDVSVVVAAILQARGFDVVTARDSGQLDRSDREQLNRVDFENLHKESLKAGKSHSGGIIARRRPLMELTARVGQLLIRLPPEALKNQLFYV